MHESWIGMLVVWAIVEIVQFFRKQPFPKRMRTGAYWGVGFAALAALGGASSSANTGVFFFTAVAVYGIGAAIIYGLRILFAKVWQRLFQKA